MNHIYDLWNTIPVLITTGEQIDGAKQLLEGSFHELKDVFRIIEWNEITKYYKLTGDKELGDKSRNTVKT